MSEAPAANIEFVCNAHLQGYVKNFESYVYNQEAFLNLLPVKEKLTYSIIKKREKTAEGQIHFFIKGNEAFSLFKSPFGGFELNEKLSLEILFDFWKFIEMDLVSKGIAKVHIKNHAEIYAPQNASKVSALLLNNKFVISDSEVNHHLELVGESLYPQLKKMKKTRLNRCYKAGFTFQEETTMKEPSPLSMKNSLTVPEGQFNTKSFSEEKENKAQELFEFIIACRKEKGYTFSMNVEELMNTLKALPDNIKLFSVRDQGKIIAATTAVIVNERIIYNFSLAALKSYDSLSPSIMLLDNLYRYGYQNQFEILDLGTSAINRQPNFNLIRFKESIGGKPGLKLTFSKTL